MKGKLTLKPREDLGEEFLSGFNTAVMIGDEELKGVRSVDIRYRPDDIVIAEVHLYCVEKEITGAHPVVVMAHPQTGEDKEVAEILFKDGTRVNFYE